MKNKLEKLIDALGKKTPEGIAKFLKSKGITGDINGAFSCPINRYLTKELKLNQNKIGVDKYTIDCFNTKNQKSVVTPQNLAHFIDNFDSGEYPELT